MCMNLARFTHHIPRVVFFGPKTVYKVMKVTDTTKEGYVRSPHRSHEYALGVLQRHRIGIRKNYSGDTLVSEGFHSFPLIADAKAELEDFVRPQREAKERWGKLGFNYWDTDEYAIYECEIPQGAKYYVGYWDFYYPAKSIPNIVSNALTIVGKVAE